MAHQLPFQPRAFLHDAWIVLPRLAVERDGPAHAVLLLHLDEPPDADAVAIVAARVIAHVGRPAADLPVEMLDIGNDPDRHVGAIRPSERRRSTMARYGNSANGSGLFIRCYSLG